MKWAWIYLYSHNSSDLSIRWHSAGDILRRKATNLVASVVPNWSGLCFLFFTFLWFDWTSLFPFVCICFPFTESSLVIFVQLVKLFVTSTTTTTKVFVHQICCEGPPISGGGEDDSFVWSELFMKSVQIYHPCMHPQYIVRSIFPKQIFIILFLLPLSLSLSLKCMI